MSKNGPICGGCGYALGSEACAKRPMHIDTNRMEFHIIDDPVKTIDTAERDRIWKWYAKVYKDRHANTEMTMTMTMTKLDDLLLWVDLETTGTDEHKDSIIEFAGIVTHQDLTHIYARPEEYKTVVKPTDRALGRLFRQPIVHNMHDENGLLDTLLHDDSLSDPIPTIGKADTVIHDWLKALYPDGRYILAGSGVGHFDMKFMRAQMPKTCSLLRYYTIDIGVIRRAVSMWLPEFPRPDHNEDKTHRAMDDIRCHLEEARWWQSRLDRGQPAMDDIQHVVDAIIDRPVADRLQNFSTADLIRELYDRQG